MQDRLGIELPAYQDIDLFLFTLFLGNIFIGIRKDKELDGTHIMFKTGSGPLEKVKILHLV